MIKYQVNSPRADEFIHEGEILATLEYASSHRNDKALVDEILAEDGKIIGVCFMDMFTKADWLDKVDFDCVIDGTLTGVVKK